jgi:ureidoacrylate peracid hydrolase
MHKVEFSEAVLGRIKARRGAVHMFDAFEPARTALMVVDMQSAFVAEGAAAEIPIAREIVPAINSMATVLRDAGGLVVWIVSTYGPDEADRWPTFFNHVMGPAAGERFRGALTEGVESHQIYPELDHDPERDLVESKNRFGAFIGSDGRLEKSLRTRGIDTVLITGTVTNICCETTAREAAALAFKTVMVSDANAARSDDEHNATLSTFLQAMGDVLATDEVIARLAPGRTSKVGVAG